VIALDDEPENLDFLARVLRPRFEVLPFTSPVEALRTLRERTAVVAVIVSDQRMPQMTGVEFLGQAAQLAADSVRVLLTAYADLNVALEAVNRGRVSAILCKPVDAETLLKEVQRAASIHNTATSLRSRMDEMTRENDALTKTIQDLEKERDRSKPT
jgi:response regulator RpfG family c-di-GMP phosphodiesterase